MIADVTPLYEACRSRKIVDLTSYTKKDGSDVTHTIGIFEIRTNEGKLWGWDVTLNDHIRAFIINDINSFEVLDQDFIPPEPWDIKIDGEVV
jgi:hypothetical protein